MIHRPAPVEKIKKTMVMIITWRKGSGPPLRGLCVLNFDKKIPPYKLFLCSLRRV
jgi:hypothetical protein